MPLNKRDPTSQIWLTSASDEFSRRCVKRFLVFPSSAATDDNPMFLVPGGFRNHED